MVVLIANRLDAIPADATILTQDEALAHQWEIINGYKDGPKVWSLKYGPGALGSISAVTGILINYHYRGKLRLGSFGAFSTYLPIVVLPALASTLYHKVFIQPPIVLREESCPVCLQVRAALFQTTIGVGYPSILAPFAAYMFATRHFTYRLPSITENPKKLFEVYKKMTRPLTMFLTVALGIHMIAAMTLTQKEIVDSHRMEQEIINSELLS